MFSSVYLQSVVTMKDDVLSLSIHGESIDDSSSRATDISDMIVVDEVGYGQDSPEPSDSREVEDEGVYQRYLDRQEDAGAFGLSSGQVGTGFHQREQQIEHHEGEGAIGPSLEHQEARLHECFVCQKVIRTKVKLHVLKRHLSWFWAPETACWTCQVREAQPGSLAQRHTMIHGTDGCVFDEGHMHTW